MSWNNLWKYSYWSVFFWSAPTRNQTHGWSMRGARSTYAKVNIWEKIWAHRTNALSSYCASFLGQWNKVSKTTPYRWRALWNRWQQRIAADDNLQVGRVSFSFLSRGISKTDGVFIKWKVTRWHRPILLNLCYFSFLKNGGSKHYNATVLRQETDMFEKSIRYILHSVQKALCVGFMQHYYERYTMAYTIEKDTLFETFLLHNVCCKLWDWRSQLSFSSEFRGS